jgi:hypothetical protein
VDRFWLHAEIFGAAAILPVSEGASAAPSQMRRYVLMTHPKACVVWAKKACNGSQLPPAMMLRRLIA